MPFHWQGINQTLRPLGAQQWILCPQLLIHKIRELSACINCTAQHMTEVSLLAQGCIVIQAYAHPSAPQIILSLWGQLIFWFAVTLWGPVLMQRHHLKFQRYKQPNWLYLWRVRRRISTFFWGEKLITSLKDAFSQYKWQVWKLGGFFAWTKIRPLVFAVFYPARWNP